MDVYDLLTALSAFSSKTRLYELVWQEARNAPGPGVFVVESFEAQESLLDIGYRDVTVVTARVGIDVQSMLNRLVWLQVSLADGSRTRFSGHVTEVHTLGRSARLARYRFRLQPWVWRLTLNRNCRVWQDQSIADIVQTVCSEHLPIARWRWTDDVSPHLAEATRNTYCCQYRESDFDFVRRLLEQEGLGWRFEEDDEGHVMVLFADSARTSAVPRDASCAADGAIRFRGADAAEQANGVQWAAIKRRLTPTRCTLLSYDYESKYVSAATAETSLELPERLRQQPGYVEHMGRQVFGNPTEAHRYATLRMQAHDARAWSWTMRSSICTLRAGSRFTLADCPYPRHRDPELMVERVFSLGFNNLPETVSEGLSAHLGPMRQPEHSALADVRAEVREAAIAQARLTGYANCIEAIDAARPWRPLADPNARRKPTAHGSQSAIVIGPDGADGDGDVYCDALARVRIRFHWQGPQDSASCWVRVSQRSAGPGMGSQFLPRIGQEVMVQFIENDIDRPVIVGALYNGVGEGGEPPTPGGKMGRAADRSVFGQASDCIRAGQGNLAGGHAPVWHGASPDDAGHRNAAAQWGIRTREFGVQSQDAGYNQLLFDDTDGQGRVQLRCTHAGTELSMGHLIHTADNYRGSFRGKGIELRTDASGCVRAGAGLLISSYGIRHDAEGRDGAGENADGIRLMKQAVALAESFSKAAITHQTVGLSSCLGTVKPGGSMIDDRSPPLAAMAAALSGMVSGTSVSAAQADAKRKNTSVTDERVPHLAAPIIAISAQAGLGVTAAQDIQIAAGETVNLISGQDTQFVTGGHASIHTGQAIGILGGAIQPGDDGMGLQLIAAQGPIDFQAQSDELKIQARDDVSFSSVNGHIDFASAKSIRLSTAGGASISIENGNITVQCPGKLTIHAGTKHFAGPARASYSLPVFPVTEVVPAQERVLESSFAFDQLTAVAQRCTRHEFIALVVTIFGYDVPATAYLRLYDALRDGTLPQPALKVMNGGHFPASFDNDTRTILVHQAAADRATSGLDESWELLTALLHEFGHYIDLVLRVDYTDDKSGDNPDVADDAPEDEGAKFAYHIAFFDFSGTHESIYAKYRSPDFSGPFKVNYAEATKAIRKSQSREAQQLEGKAGSKEYFGAGRGEHHKERPHSSFGHESIEAVLASSHRVFDRPLVRRLIYFGNWLRDHSQLLDPAIVRKPDEPKNFPEKLSRAALTEIVSVLAETEFVESEAQRKLFEVTPSILGVYRPSEHIDNPTSARQGAPDPRTIDKDFEEPATKASTAIDPLASMKRYIQRSRTYMENEIRGALDAGPTPLGFRRFGAALHVLEDYFAHSNFVELSLIKLGYSAVLPWTSPTDCKHRLPVVTGMFDSDDVIASTAGTIADLLFKVEWEYQATKPGERTKADKLMLILLREHSDKAMLARYEEYLRVRDAINTTWVGQNAGKALHYTFGMIRNVQNFMFASLIHLVGNSVDDQQVLRTGDPKIWVY